MNDLPSVGTPVRVVAGDYEYVGRVAAAFPKLRSGAIRVVVEDDCGRLFIHNPGQLRALVDPRRGAGVVA